MQAKLGISQAYASMILRGDRIPPRPLAIRMLREFEWRHPSIADFTDDEIALFERADPWVPPAERPTQDAPTPDEQAGLAA